MSIFTRQDIDDQTVLGVEDDQTYFGILAILLKNRDAPDGFLLQHPDFDEEHERAYYEQYLNELFLGEPAPGFGDILEWEGLWLDAFAPILTSLPVRGQRRPLGWPICR